MTPEGEAELIVDEGDVAHLYYDTRGIPTIGIGCNLRDVRVPDALARLITITPEASRALFALRLESAEADVAAHLPWTAQLDTVRRDVVTNMCFNMGIGRLMARNPLALRAAEHGDYPEAARQMLDGPWVRQVGDRARRLARQMETGQR